MDLSQQVPRNDSSTPEDAEVSMEPQVIQETDLTSGKAISDACCVHQRLIDDVRTRSGKRTGKVRCLECGTIFDDPYQGSK